MMNNYLNQSIKKLIENSEIITIITITALCYMKHIENRKNIAILKDIINSYYSFLSTHYPCTNNNQYEEESNNEYDYSDPIKLVELFVESFINDKAKLKNITSFLIDKGELQNKKTSFLIQEAQFNTERISDFVTVCIMHFLKMQFQNNNDQILFSEIRKNPLDYKAIINDLCHTIYPNMQKNAVQHLKEFYSNYKIQQLQNSEIIKMQNSEIINISFVAATMQINVQHLSKCVAMQEQSKSHVEQLQYNSQNSKEQYFHDYR